MTFRARLELRGRRALVTGAAAGIGRATALAIASRGAFHVVLVDLDADGLELIALEVEAAGARPHVLVADAGDLPRMSSLLEGLGLELDLLVNAAGNVASTGFLELGRDEWDDVLHSHVKTVFTTCRLLAPGMVARGYGRIVNVASVAGKRGGGFLGKTPYAGAKAAVNGLTKALARELAPHGVRVNSVNPGLTDTRRLDSLRADPELWSRCLAAVPLGRVADPAEVAAAIVFLLSDASDYITGETLNVDGGIAME
jgi:NAD(P)-dependent dehydrogenase (short-subunit alcohol dehydrogenase family)